MRIDNIDPVRKTYKGLALEDAEIKEVGEIIIEKYIGLVLDGKSKLGHSRCPKKE